MNTDQIDINGAKQAKQSSNILYTLIQEPFLPIHVRAQKRVPMPEILKAGSAVPEILDLRTVFSGKGWKRLMNIELSNNINVNDINIIYTPPSNYTTNNSYSSNSSNISNNIQISPWADSHHQRLSSPNNRPGTGSDNMYYLSSNSTTLLSNNNTNVTNSGVYTSNTNYTNNNSNSNSIHAANPLSQLLASTFEDDRADKKGRKGKGE